jgi:heme-degrading monooxygenase HmoA
VANVIHDLTASAKEHNMSVIVITKFPGKAADLERLASGEHADTLRRISEDGRAQGCLHHQFAEDSDGNVLVVDEWDSADSFNAFFAAQDDIKKLAADAGVAGPPTSTSHRILDTPDRF